MVSRRGPPAPVILPYSPRKQMQSFHQRQKRWAVVVAHRRAGKTVACVNELIRGALACRRKAPRFAYLAPLYKQAKDIAWCYVKDYSAAVPGVRFNETELRADFPNGGRVRLYGSDNPDSLRGIYLDGVVLDEYADMNPRVWGEVVRPALSDRRGWAVFIGTPKGRNAFLDLYEAAREDPRWFALILRASESGLLPADELADAQANMTAEQFAQEYECSFDAAIAGAYFAREMGQAEAAGRICTLAPQPGLKVHAVWDLGIGDSTAVWLWQAVGREIRVLDFHEASGVGLDHHVRVLTGLGEAGGYLWGDDWVPHDAKVRELGTGRTRIETLVSLGRKPRLVPNHSFEDGINAARLSFERVWFDRKRCRAGLEALRQYRADFDPARGVFSPRPRHDWTSHAADAFRYLSMAFRETKADAKAKRSAAASGVTLDSLWRNPGRSDRRI